MCAGSWWESKRMEETAGIRPPRGTPCDEGENPCINKEGRWGSSYCKTNGGTNWGAECTEAESTLYHSKKDELKE